MIISKGTDNFQNNTFDKYRWSANTYETPKEIHAFLENHNILSKKITGIRAIGSLIHGGIVSWKSYAASVLKKAGIIERYDYIHNRIIFPDRTEKAFNDCTDLFYNVKAPLSVNLYEPLIFMFDDGSSLEMMPASTNGIRMSYCAIPGKMTDGVNHREWDIGILFDEHIKGKNIREIDINKKTEHFESFVKIADSPIHRYNRHFYEYVIRLSDYGSLNLSGSENSGFELKTSWIKSVNCSDLNVISALSYKQLCIYEAAGSGGALNIHTGRTDDDSICGEEIYVWNIPGLAWNYMDKYFDKSLNPHRLFQNRLYEHYDTNLYSIENSVKLGTELFELALFAENNPFDDRCDCLFRNSGWDERKMSKQEYLRLNPSALIPEIDYAKRFAKRIIGLAENAEGFDCLAFCGP